MTRINDLSDAINLTTGVGNPEHIFFFKDNRIGSVNSSNMILNRMTSLWQYNGNPSGSSITPTTGLNPNNLTEGALKQTNPSGGKQKWLLGMTATSFAGGNAFGVLILYDRLFHMGGLSGTTTTTQAVNGSVSRYTGLESPGNVIWLEIYTAIGSTATTVSATYTNQNGASGITSQVATIGGTGFSEAQRIIPIGLFGGDTGVQSVDSVKLVGSTGTAGNFGITIARPLLAITLPDPCVGAVKDTISILNGIIEIKNEACLALAFLAGGSERPQFMGSLHMVEK